MQDHLEPARGFGYRKLETELMFGTGLQVWFNNKPTEDLGIGKLTRRTFTNINPRPLDVARIGSRRSQTSSLHHPRTLREA